MSKLIGLPEFCNVNPTIKHNDIQFPHTQAIPCNHSVLLKENYLSEFLTKQEKQKVLENLGINTSIEWGEIGGYIDKQPDLIEKLKGYILKETKGNTATEQISYVNEAYPNINTLQEALDVALYQDLTISIKISPSVAESGDSIENVLLTWSYNKSNIKQQTIDDTTIDSNIRQLELEGPIVSSTTKKVVGNDGTKTVIGQVTLNFYPGIYYGSGISQPPIQSMEKVLLPSRSCRITVNAEQNEYIWILLPINYGDPIFTVGGFSGGFQKVGSTSYKITNYNIWRSDNHSLGNTTINIS